MVKTAPKITLECSGSFHVNILPDGRVSIELEAVTGLPETSGEVLYDKRGVAKRMGATLRSVENWMTQKKHPLPFIRHCGRPKFRESDIEWWLAQGCSVAARRASAALLEKAYLQNQLPSGLPPVGASTGRGL